MSEAEEPRIIFDLSRQLDAFTRISPDAFDGARRISIPADMAELNTTLIIEESHMEGDVKVIDKAKIVEVHLYPQPLVSDKALVTASVVSKVTCFICGGDSNRTCSCHNGDGAPCDMVCNP